MKNDLKSTDPEKIEYDKDGAIISMNNFCEIHGPQILIATYLAKPFQENQNALNLEESSEEEELNFEKFGKDVSPSKKIFTPKLQVLFPSNSKLESPPLNSSLDCSSCKSIDIGQGYLTPHPNDDSKFLITSRFPVKKKK